MTTKTKALLDYGEVAFRDVDAKLAVLLGGDSLPVGTAVELTGLSNDAFNGRRGIVTETPSGGAPGGSSRGRRRRPGHRPQAGEFGRGRAHTLGVS